MASDQQTAYSSLPPDLRADVDLVRVVSAAFGVNSSEAIAAAAALVIAHREREVRSNG